MSEIERLKFPIGRFQWVEQLSKKEVTYYTRQIKDFPNELEQTLATLKNEDYQKFYRPGGWQIGQVVHHLADSHLISYVRFKQALTFDTPTVMDYNPDDWAKLPDAVSTPIDSSLMILKGVHNRWTVLLEQTAEEALKRRYYHPNRDKYYSLATVLALYVWHGQHHLAHIRNTF